MALVIVGIVLFCAGFAAGCGFMAWAVKFAAQVEGAIEEGTKGATPCP